MKAPPAAPEWYTTAEVARFFSVDPKTVSRWAFERRLPERAIARTPGGEWRFRASYIDSWLAGGDAA